MGSLRFATQITELSLPSNEYKQFATEYSFKHTRSSPYHPQGNGRAEAAVKVAKNMLKKTKDFHAAMLNYRNTPQEGHSYSPAQRMMNHRTKNTTTNLQRTIATQTC